MYIFRMVLAIHHINVICNNNGSKRKEKKSVTNINPRAEKICFRILQDSIYIYIFSKVFVDVSHVKMDGITQTLCLIFSDNLWWGKRINIKVPKVLIQLSWYFICYKFIFTGKIRFSSDVLIVFKYRLRIFFPGWSERKCLIISANECRKVVSKIILLWTVCVFIIWSVVFEICGLNFLHASVLIFCSCDPQVVL